MFGHGHGHGYVKTQFVGSAEETAAIFFSDNILLVNLVRFSFFAQ